MYDCPLQRSFELFELLVAALGRGGMSPPEKPSDSSVNHVTTPAPTVCVLTNTRGDIAIPDLHALEHRIRAIKSEMPALAKDAAEVEGERKVSTQHTAHHRSFAVLSADGSELQW